MPFGEDYPIPRGELGRLRELLGPGPAMTESYRKAEAELARLVGEAPALETVDEDRVKQFDDRMKLFEAFNKTLAPPATFEIEPTPRR